ncbi:ATP-dependent DNA ligase [Microcoleus sp. FACHB-1515]|uniref:ATP-dependent DNA ligase n=1 Tax=Cyanophyceae TaxID=3028117 RepID=UPI00168619B5|nr:ATP-dependent DNA ligase [Microcoleus sp. FACHB-1515]MBD2089998.1 ATP-dependent DNA ligase [Microcoleus sp. FACHB-1515]
MTHAAATSIATIPGAFQQFAHVAEQVGATTKRLEKAAILGDYFTSLSDDDLLYAARYFAGYAFPLRDQRTTNVGGAGLLAALAVITQIEPNDLKVQLVKLGDLGDVSAQVFPDRTPQPPLTLSDVAIALEQLANTKGSKRKVEWVITLLKKATRLESKYIIKLLSGDLRIGLKEGAVEDAIARLAGETVGRIQWVNMLTGDIGETALLARHQQLDQAKMRLFHPIRFMLASPAEDLEAIAKQMPNEFAVEDKFDGIRAQVHVAPAVEGEGKMHGAIVHHTRVALFSRTLDEITGSFPDLVEPLANVFGNSGEFILDGEIVPMQDGKILPFQELQKRLGRKTLPPELLAAVPIGFIAYDILYANGEVLIELPYRVRQAKLAQLPLDTTFIRRAVSQVFTDTAALDAEFTAARDRGNEGLMVKNLDSTYKPGRRGRDWLKVKRALATLDVVITAAEVGSGRRSKFLSDYTFAVRTSETDPTLLNVGKAYSGLTDAEIQELSDWCRAHTLQEFAHGKVRTVEPKIVLEVTFDRVQASKRHKGGYALRFPRILRIRTDKPVEEIDTIETVRQLAVGEPESE